MKALARSYLIMACYNRRHPPDFALWFKWYTSGVLFTQLHDW